MCLPLYCPGDVAAQRPVRPLAEITERVSRELEPGLRHTHLAGAATADHDPWSALLLAVDLSRYHLDVVLAIDQIAGTETTSAIVARSGASAGVNGGFFVTEDPAVGDPAGFLVIDGTVVSEPDRLRPSIGFCDRVNRQEVRILRAVLDIGLEPRLPPGSRPGLNRARDSADIVLYTPDWGRSTLTRPGGVEVVVRGGEVIAIEEKGSSRIPDDGFILSASGAIGADLRERYPLGMRAGYRLEVTDENGRPVDLRKCDYTTAGPVVAEDGRVREDYAGEAYREGFVIDRHPRTAVGLSADSATLYLFTIDGRQQGFSAGATLVELARILVAEGANTVYNLDGGGSTTMAVRYEGVLNRPSDGSERRPSDMVLAIRRR